MRDRFKFFERLSHEGQRLVPVNYRFMEPLTEEFGSVQRLAESHFYNAHGYCCWGFRKPISRCCTRSRHLGPQEKARGLAEEESCSQAAAAAKIKPGDSGRQSKPKPTDIFLLFACCVPVRGARRSLICDLQRSVFYFIPNGLYKILTDDRGKTVDAIKALYQHAYDQEIDEYFEFLIIRELGFWCTNPGHFPHLNLAWDAPERITNAIIDVGTASQHDYAKLLDELDDLGCKALQFRFFCRPSLRELEAILQAAAYGRLRSIDIIAAYSEELTTEAVERLIAPYQRVNSIIIHSAPERRSSLIGRNVILRYLTQIIDSPACCGQVHPKYFAINLETFTEAQNFNSCLNRKVSIDAHGNIKNCPSLPRSFGNTRDTSLHSAVAHRDFAGLWEINKDQIEICKDCEFRYICTDCRAYLSSPGDLYSKPSKCTYDPYTAEWRLPT
jgi:SPASM domain peptide maturase of grasp-with-spasm system